MTDRELVQKAAKACGKEIDLDRYDDEMGFIILGISRWWNPLTNDGDAFRLALKLGIQIGDAHQYGPALAHTDGRLPFAEYWEPVIDGDIYAATRRAITRAAAAIQEAKEGV